jgi:hypothetical protein
LLGVDLLDADCLPACCIALMPDAVVCLLQNRDWYREEIRERCYMGRDKRDTFLLCPWKKIRERVAAMGRFKRERKRDVPPAGRRGPAAIF